LKHIAPVIAAAYGDTHRMRIPEFTLTILGSGSALPMPGRSPAAQVLRYGQTGILVDCGEGTQVRMRDEGVKAFQIGLVLVSHLHGDHVFGLPGLLSSMNHLGRREALHVIGPPGIRRLLETVAELSELQFHFELTVQEVRPSAPEVVWSDGDLEVRAFPLTHRIPTLGYLVRERKLRIRFNKEEITARGLDGEAMAAISARLAKGIEPEDPDLGVLYQLAHPVGYAYCSDTRFDPRVASWVRHVPVLYHETTFLDHLAGLAFETGHSTAAEAGKLATMAEAGWLVTGHYSSREKDNDVYAAEARLHFPRVLAGRDGLRLDLRALADEAGPVG